MMLISVTPSADGYAIGMYRKNGRRVKLERCFESDDPGPVVEDARKLGYMKPRRATTRAWRRGWTGDVVAMTKVRPA